MGELLQRLSQALVATVEAAGGSVVRVEGRDRLPATGLVWSADGVIVTAHHTLEREAGRVGLPEGGTAPARVVGRDPGVGQAGQKTAADRQRTPARAPPPNQSEGARWCWRSAGPASG